MRTVIPIDCGQRFRSIADSVPVIADSGSRRRLQGLTRRCRCQAFHASPPCRHQLSSHPLVRSAPSFRPDPHAPRAGARSGGQGWPVFGPPRQRRAASLTAASTTAGSIASGAPHTPDLGQKERARAAQKARSCSLAGFFRWFAQGLAVEGKAVRGVHEAVEDGIGDCRIDDHLVPVIDGELTGHNRRAAAMAIVDDFEQVAALLRGQWRQPPVIEDQKLDTGEALEEAYIPSVAACQCKCVEQAWYAIVEHRSIVTARLVSERAGEPALAGAGFPSDQEVVSPPDPVAGRELGEQRLVETARRLCVEVLDGGGLPEVGKLEPGDETPAFALDGLAIDEEADPLLEHERSNRGLLPLLLERLGHADETEGDQPIVCGMWKHVSFLCFLFARIFLRAPPLAGLPGARDHPGVAQW